MSDWAGKTPTPEQWRDILEKHAKWLRSESGGSRAYLSRANLSGAYLSGADLSRADLSRANLSGADLSRADLSGADLSRANLSGAYLSRANLSRANLSRANLSGAYLSGADLSGADLSRANLSRAKDAELAISMTRILPEGELVGWKKCRYGVIVRLSIPAKAKRSHAFGRKCRAEYAKVKAIFPKGAKAESLHEEGFFYRVGATVKPASWDDNWQRECSGGIHFYIMRAEAEAHS